MIAPPAAPPPIRSTDLFFAFLFEAWVWYRAGSSGNAVLAKKVGIMNAAIKTGRLMKVPLAVSRAM
jgi:hypothetical protein